MDSQELGRESMERMEAQQREEEVAEAALRENELIEQRDETFSVTDGPSANWVIQKYLAAKEYAESVQRYADLEGAKAARAMAFYQDVYFPQLRSFAMLASKGAKVKYVNLPGGRLQLREEPLKFVVEDDALYTAWVIDNVPEAVTRTLTINLTALPPYAEAALMEWAAQYKEAGYVQEKLDVSKNAVNAYFKTMHEIPAGCTTEGGDDKLFVQPLPQPKGKTRREI
jgi:hypothetical protein